MSTAAEVALIHGTTIGGARPKVLVSDADGAQWIAKLSASSDSVFSVMNAEAAALELARHAGIDTRESAFAACVSAAHIYGLSTTEAREIIDSIVGSIHTHWSAAADAGRLSEADRTRLWGRQILNPYALRGYTS